MSKINEFAKDIILFIFRTMFNYWYVLALVVLIIYLIVFIGRFKAFKKISTKFKNKSLLAKAIIIIFIFIIISVILR